MGPIEQRELAKRVAQLEDRLNAYETWRADVNRRLKAVEKPVRKSKEN